MSVKGDIGIGIGTLVTGNPAKENKGAAGIVFRVIIIELCANYNITLTIAVKIPC